MIPVRQASEIEAEVARLRGLDLMALRARWRTVTGRAAPGRLARPLLVRILAHRIQADAFGDLSRESTRILERIADGMAAPAPVRARAGAVLVREWNGVNHHVMAVGEGFAWNGSTYRSLSEVARAITGTRWSGPRFFGLAKADSGNRARLGP